MREHSQAGQINDLPYLVREACDVRGAGDVRFVACRWIRQVNHPPST